MCYRKNDKFGSNIRLDNMRGETILANVSLGVKCEI